MLRLRAFIAASLIFFASAASCWAHEEEVMTEETVLGMTYGQAALVTAAVVAGAVALNTFAASNVATVLSAIYLGHLAVEAAIVLTGAGTSWGLGWWDDAPADLPTN
jgi:hypothetical protein